MDPSLPARPRVVVAMDSFKGSVGSLDAGEAVAAGIRDALPSAEVRVLALADGGEGTIAAVRGALGGDLVAMPATDALGRALVAEHLVLPDGTHVLESARTIGLALVRPVDATLALRGSSAGLGTQLRHALDLGARRVVVGLGGTATTDGGTGLWLALGARLDPDAGPGRNTLWLGPRVAAPPVIGDVDLVVLSDVVSPLLGPAGAARVFGPQKGATPEQVDHLERAMTAWAAELSGVAGRDVAALPGAGAAGGLGAALMALGARVEPGLDHVARAVGLDAAVAGADLVVTGEGRIDAQTGAGKGPAGVARRARAAGVRVAALAGRLAPDAPVGLFDLCRAVHPADLAIEEAMDRARTLAALRAAAADAARLLVP